MILFLDFDGVLHGDGAGLELNVRNKASMQSLTDEQRRFITHDGRLIVGENLFGHADRLVVALEPYPDVQIVISSTWREHFHPGTLLRYLPPALADRVIGQTPHCDKYGGVGSRLNEVLAYLDGNGFTDRTWIAIDDQAQLFWDDTENPPDNLFIIGNDGLTETASIAFCQWLREIKE